MTDLNQLQIFTMIAQEMSFTRAGAALGISKAAVSRAVASLEGRLSARLFERTTRRLALTEAGETYLAHAKRAMEEAEDAEAAVSKLSELPRGTLRVIMPVTMARSSVGPNLAGFLRTYPELRIEITLRGGRLDPIADQVDVVFQTSRPETDSQIIQRRMSTVNVGIYASKHYLATAPPLRSPQDLTKHSCITMTTAHGGTTWNLYKEGKAQEVRLRGRVSVGDPIVHHQLCRDGVGVATIPEWEVREDVKKRHLQRVLSAWTPSPIEVYVLYPTRLSMTPKLNAFLRFMDGLLPA
jgi:DNA-binding transcriptional LysR family regulator